MSLLGWIYLLFALGVVNSLVATLCVKSFLSKTSSISSALDLDHFKRLARQQMYQALLQIGSIGSVTILWLYGMFVAHQMGFLLILILNGILILANKPLKSLEIRVRSLPVSDQSLEGQYRAVCEAWVHKAFPNF